MSKKTKSAMSASQSADKSRMLSLIAVSLAVLMVTLIALVFWRMIAIGREAAISSHPSQSTSTQASATSTSANPQATPTIATLKEGREKLKTLSDDSTCQGEVDAAFLIEFARLSEEAEQWNTDKYAVTERLKELLANNCGEAYMETLANRLSSASTPSGLAEVVDTVLPDTVTGKHPIPDTAIDMANFRAPSNNIHCGFNNGKLSCTIYSYSYTSDCQGKPVTYSIASDGTLTQSCATPVTSNSGVSYDTTVAHDGLACTITQDGVECWHERSGNGFKLSRSAISQF